MKMEKAGFRDIQFHERRSIGIDDLAVYPLFTPDLLALMRRLMPPAVQQRIGAAIVISARLSHAGRRYSEPR